MAALTEDAERELELAELRSTLRRTQRKLAKAEQKTAELVEAVYEGAKDATLIVGKPAPIPAPAKDRRRGQPEECVVHFSDWQLGKVCGHPGDADYYDQDVCIARVRHVVEKVRRITEIQRKDHPVPGCTILFGGDHVEGTQIFPGNAWEIGDSTGYSQLVAAAGLMTETVLSLLQDFDHVTVHSVHGNHGRLGRRGEMPREDNLDNIAFALSRAQLGEQRRLTWEENLHWYSHVQIGNYRALLIHGDQIKGVSGTPVAAIARAATSWAPSLPVEWSDCFVGHYHQNTVITLPSGGQLRMSPSTESGSQYASEFMRAKGRPGQRLVFVHPEKAIVTGEYMVWL